MKILDRSDIEAFKKLKLKIQTIPLIEIWGIYVILNVVAIVPIVTAHYVVSNPAFLQHWINETGGGLALMLLSMNYVLFPLVVGLAAEKIANIFIPLILIYRMIRWLYKKKYGFEANF